MRIKLGWPATLRESSLFDKPVVLHPNRARDARAWQELRVRNAQWLHPWETTDPKSPSYPTGLKTYLAMMIAMRGEAMLGHALPWAVSYGDELVGQVSIGNIVWGAERTGHLGAWIDKRFARHHIMLIALAMAIDHAFQDVGLHRIVASVRPENTASRRGVEKYGFRQEGLWVGHAYVDGAWRDHLCYALTAEEVPDGIMPRCRSEVLASKSGAAI
jgi:ribosomal-protein-alanine N-acetyltransferase